MRHRASPLLAIALTVAAGLTGWAGRADAQALACAGKQAIFLGTPESEILRGTTARDAISGLGGNDRIIGRSANDISVVTTTIAGVSTKTTLSENGGIQSSFVKILIMSAND